MNQLEQKPDFHMKGLAQSGSAKDYGELTVVLLGYATKLQEEAYLAGYQARTEEVLSKLEDAIFDMNFYTDGGTPANEVWEVIVATLKDTKIGKDNI